MRAIELEPCVFLPSGCYVIHTQVTRVGSTCTSLAASHVLLESTELREPPVYVPGRQVTTKIQHSP